MKQIFQILYYLLICGVLLSCKRVYFRFDTKISDIKNTINFVANNRSYVLSILTYNDLDGKCIANDWDNNKIYVTVKNNNAIIYSGEYKNETFIDRGEYIRYSIEVKYDKKPQLGVHHIIKIESVVE